MENKKSRPVLQHHGGKGKTFTDILHDAARAVNYVAGVLGLCSVMVFGIPPLIGIGQWHERPLIIGALLVIVAAIVEAFDNAYGRRKL